MKARLKTLIEKLRFKYKISILNENTLEETHSFKLSQLNVIIVFVALLFIIFAFYSLIILFTPLRDYLPEYSSTGMRESYMRNALVTDSLRNVINEQNLYISTLRDVVTGDVDVKSRSAFDTIATDSSNIAFSSKTKREENFLKDYEENESVDEFSSQMQDSPANTFFPPLKGIIRNKFNPRNGSYGIDIVAKTSSPVCAALSGTIIHINFTIREGYTILMNNEDHFISVYSNLSDILVSPAQKIHAGQPIAISQNSKTNSGESAFHFELWQNSIPLNPENFIIF